MYFTLFSSYYTKEYGTQSKITSLYSFSFRLVPTGVITFQRSVLEKKNFPQWPSINEPLSDLYLTTDKRIEDIPNTLQVDHLLPL